MSYPQKSIGKEKAIALYKSGWWKERPAKEVALFQFSVVELCLPFSEFHRVTEEALGRSVWTHEFADMGSLIAELQDDKPAPTMQEIIALIPADKRLILTAPEPPTAA